MNAKLVAGLAALGLLALPLLARPDNGGRADGSVMTNTAYPDNDVTAMDMGVDEVNAVEVDVPNYVDTNMEVYGENMTDLYAVPVDAAVCAPGDSVCRRAEKDMEQAVSDATNAAEAAAEAAADAAEAATDNLADPER